MKKINKKGQYIVLGMMVLLLVFMLAFALYMNYVLDEKDEGVFKFVQKDTLRLSDALLSTGFPTDWDNQSVARIGIVDKNIINFTKLETFIEIVNNSYDESKLLLGLERNYFLEFEESNLQQHHYENLDFKVICPSNQPSTGNRTNTLDIEVTIPGNYAVKGLVHRGNPSQFQDKESFVIEVGGVNGTNITDDEDINLIVEDYFDLGNFSFEEGNNTITMYTLTEPSDCLNYGQWQSVHINSLHLYAKNNLTIGYPEMNITDVLESAETVAIQERFFQNDLKTKLETITMKVYVYE